VCEETQQTNSRHPFTGCRMTGNLAKHYILPHNYTYKITKYQLL